MHVLFFLFLFCFYFGRNIPSPPSSPPCIEHILLDLAKSIHCNIKICMLIILMKICTNNFLCELLMAHDFNHKFICLASSNTVSVPSSKGQKDDLAASGLGETVVK